MYALEDSLGVVSFLVGKERTSCYSSIVFLVVLCSSSSLCHRLVRLISGVDVDIAPMKAYQPLQFHTLSFANIFQSRVLIYAGSNLYDEIAEEKKVFESNMVILVKDINMSKKISICKRITSHQTLKNFIKVSKEAKIRNRYNQVSHLTQDTTRESDKTQ